MTRTWIVRLLADDGTHVEGRLVVNTAGLTFRAGTKGTLVPALEISRDRIARVEQVDRDFVWS